MFTATVRFCLIYLACDPSYFPLSFHEPIQSYFFCLHPRASAGYTISTLTLGHLVSWLLLAKTSWTPPHASSYYRRCLFACSKFTSSMSKGTSSKPSEQYHYYRSATCFSNIDCWLHLQPVLLSVTFFFFFCQCNAAFPTIIIDLSTSEYILSFWYFESTPRTTSIFVSERKRFFDRSRRLVQTVPINQSV